LDWSLNDDLAIISEPIKIKTKLTYNPFDFQYADHFLQRFKNSVDDVESFFSF